jgi:hypothetical protein
MVAVWAADVAAWLCLGGLGWCGGGLGRCGPGRHQIPSLALWRSGWLWRGGFTQTAKVGRLAVWWRSDAGGLTAL